MTEAGLDPIITVSVTKIHLKPLTFCATVNIKTEVSN